MTAFYDEIELDDMRFNVDLQAYVYPCPCGDEFQITLVSRFLFLADSCLGRDEIR